MIDCPVTRDSVWDYSSGFRELIPGGTMRRGKSVLWVSLLMLLAFVVSAHANSILDQDNQPFGDSHMSDELEWQQQVTATFGEVLSGITLYTLSGTDTALVRIGVGSAPFTGAWAFETIAGIGPG